MKTRWLLGVVALFVSMGLAAGSAVAKEKPKKGDKDQELSGWDDMTVEGDVLKPKVTDVTKAQQDVAASLLEIRQDFVDELTRSAEDL